MFVHFPYHFVSNLRHTVLILNTLVLIIVLVAAEFLYVGASKTRRRELRAFLPLITVLVGLLGYAVYLQGKGL